MKTISEIKDEVSKESNVNGLSFPYWDEMVHYFSGRHPLFFEPLWDMVVKRYAEEAIKEAANIISHAGMNESDLQDVEQILNLIKELK